MLDDIVKYTHESTNIIVAMFAIFVMYRLLKMAAHLYAGLFPTYCPKPKYDLAHAQHLVDKAYQERVKALHKANANRRALNQEEVPIPDPPARLTHIRIDNEDRYTILGGSTYLIQEGHSWIYCNPQQNLEDLVAFLAMFPQQRLWHLPPILATLHGYYRSYPDWEFCLAQFDEQELMTLAVSLPKRVVIKVRPVLSWGGVKGFFTAYFTLEAFVWPMVEAATILAGHNVDPPVAVQYSKYLMFGLDIAILLLTVGFLATLCLHASTVARRSRLAIYFLVPFLNMWSSAMYAHNEQTTGHSLKLWLSLASTGIMLFTFAMYVPAYARERRIIADSMDTPAKKADKDVKAFGTAATKSAFHKVLFVLYFLSLVISTVAETTPNSTTDLLIGHVEELPHHVKMTKESFANYIPESDWQSTIDEMDASIQPYGFWLQTPTVKQLFYWDPTINCIVSVDNATRICPSVYTVSTTSSLTQFCLNEIWQRHAAAPAPTASGCSHTYAIIDGWYIQTALMSFIKARPYNVNFYYPFTTATRKKRDVSNRPILTPNNFYRKVDPHDDFEKPKPKTIPTHLHHRMKRWTLLGICIFCDDGGVSKETFNTAINRIWKQFNKIEHNFIDLNQRINTAHTERWLLWWCAEISSIWTQRQDLIQSIEILSGSSDSVNPSMMSLTLSVAFDDLLRQAQTYATANSLTLVNITRLKPTYTTRRVSHGLWILGAFFFQEITADTWYKLSILSMFSQPRINCLMATVATPYTLLYSIDAKEYVVAESASIASLYCYDGFCTSSLSTTLTATTEELEWFQSMHTALLGRSDVFFPLPASQLHVPRSYVYKHDCWISGFGGWFLHNEGILSIWVNESTVIKITTVATSITKTYSVTPPRWTAYSYTITGSVDVQITTGGGITTFRVTSSTTAHVDIIPFTVPIIDKNFHVAGVSSRRYFLNTGDPPLATGNTSDSDLPGSWIGHLISGGIPTILFVILIAICICQHSGKACFRRSSTKTARSTSSSDNVS